MTGGGTILWNGRPVPFRPGDSAAQALHRAGVSQFGQHATGQPRSVFCGIGQCQNCVVLIDGEGPKEACLLPCRDGLDLWPTTVTENG